jgi:(2R)-sulfolactate sulfo-lyase subunit alpha
MDYKFLIHEPGDSVGVAVVDIKAGESVAGTFLHDHTKSLQVVARNDIPLGHKIALVDVPEKGKVVKYGVVIGGAVKPITAGDHVHVHNLKSLRWGK